jgi:hypothetical protein
MEDWLREAYAKLEKMPAQAKEVRERALNDLNFFAKLVNPNYVYGNVHKEIFNWMQDYSLFGMDGTSGEKTANKLIMLPRAHLKSHMVATWCAWIATRHPEVSMLYLSATAELAITQLYAVKNIFLSGPYQRYFPEYINPQEGKREKWSSTAVILDHPKVKKEGIRDATIKTAGLTTNTTGWHADIIVSDDLVVPENAYTEDGRSSVLKKASQFTSIRNSGGFTMACGTRYHPNDIYATWKDSVYSVYDSEGVMVGKAPVWEIKEYVVEEDGVFIWPRRVRDDGKAFGFDIRELARIEAEYNDRIQFYAQYYNNPNDPGSDRLSRENFQYFNQRLLRNDYGSWKYNGKRLNIYAAVDFAFSLNKKADWTAIVVVGVDGDGMYYVLDVDNYIRQDGLTLSVDKYRPNRHEGSKEERIAAALEPLYDDMRVYHFEGGWTDQLEEELVQARPKHDDVKDALASAVSIAVKPKGGSRKNINEFLGVQQSGQRSRFGGIPYK